MNDDDTRSIDLSIQLDASPEDVFRAIADGDELAKWLAPEARVTLPTGDVTGKIWISWGEGMSAEHEIDIYDAPKRLRHPSGQHPQTKAPLYVDWTIEARDGGTATLRLVHSGFSKDADWDDEFESLERGWTLMLRNLQHYFARHPQQPATYAPFMAPMETSRHDLWRSLLGALGFEATPAVGDTVRVTTSEGETLTGEVDLVTDTRDLAFVVREYDDALVRFTFEGKSDATSTFVYGYVIAYGDSQAHTETLTALARAALPS